MAFKESEFITKIIRPYAVKNKWKTGAIEAKVSKGNTCPFSAFQFHQIPTLERVAEDQIIYKPSDMSIDLKPADLIILNKEPSWVAILFKKDETPRKVFYMIHIKEVLKLQNIPGKKSITRDDCEKYGEACYC